MNGEEEIVGLLADAKDQLSAAQMSALQKNEPELRGYLGQTESIIERAFDALNGGKTPPRITPEEVMGLNVSHTSGNGSSCPLTEKDDTSAVCPCESPEKPSYGAVIGTEMEKKSRTFLNIGEECQDGEAERAKIGKKPDDFGTVDEKDVDAAIGKGDSLQDFFSTIAKCAVKGEIVKYKEKGFGDGSAWKMISFVLNTPQSKKAVYASFLMREFNRWADEYGYDLKGTYCTTASRNVYFELLVADREENREGSSDRDKKWAELSDGANQRLSGNLDGYEYAEQYRKHVDEFKCDSSMFDDIRKDYQPHKEAELRNSICVERLFARASELSDIVDAAAMSILSANKKGGGRRPSKAKVARVSSEVVAILRFLADKAIVFGLRAVAMFILKKLNLGEAILALVARDDYTITAKEELAFKEGI